MSLRQLMLHCEMVDDAYLDDVVHDMDTYEDEDDMKEDEDEIQLASMVEVLIHEEDIYNHMDNYS